MLICHYLGSISVGLLFRNYGKESLSNKKSSLKTNVLNTINNRYKDDRGFLFYLEVLYLMVLIRCSLLEDL